MRLKDYQTDDLARLSLLDGAILSWQCGLGKTVAMFCWALMKCGWTGRLHVNAPVLIVSPEDLHKQTIREGEEKFGIQTRKFTGQDVEPGFYIVSYSALANMLLPPDLFACVMVDEGDKTKKRGSDSGMAVRRLQPKYRLICTATPLADRLRDLFWLCSWVTANDPPEAQRWPFRATGLSFSRFSQRFQVECENLTRGTKERSAEISKLIPLWRILGGIVLRRRMEDSGEKIVGLTMQIIPCPLGWRQKAEYEQTLFKPGVDLGTRMNALRRIAGGAGWPNPKLVTALELIAERISRGEQVLVASDFRGPNDAIAERLRECRIPYVLMDGRSAPAVRADMADKFRSMEIPVALIGLKSGAEGHSYPRCNNLIILNYSWELKKLPQVIGRARRINSERDLNVWSLICDGTIEKRMAQLIVEEKAQASDLVLDGIWPSLEDEKVENWLQIATKEFRVNVPSENEQEIQRNWPALKQKIQLSCLNFLDQMAA